MSVFIYSFQSEWLKKKRSFASVLVVAGALLVPMIFFIARLVRYKHIPAESASPLFWENHWNTAWQFVSVMLLPLGVALAASLVTQLEFRNNTWKQLHTTPQSLTVIFSAKLVVLLVMLVQFFALFNAGIYLSGVLPALLTGAPYPQAPYPFAHFLRESALYFLDCLPVLALQYLIGLQFRNFIVPVATGIAFWIISVVMLNWEYGYCFPYTYSALHFFSTTGERALPVSVHALAAIYFAVFTAAGYILYVKKKEKG